MATNDTSGTATSSPSNSLRQFRFQKKPQVDSSTNGHNNEFDSPASDGVDGVRRKRIMIFESSDDDKSPMKNPPVGLRGLMAIFPQVDPQVIEKYLIECQGDFAKAKQNIRLQYCSPNQSNDVPQQQLEGKRKRSPEPTNGFKQKAKKYKKIKRMRDDSEDGSASEGDDGYKEDSRVFDSDDDSDAEISTDMTSDQRKVLDFLNDATLGEILCMPQISRKKADIILEQKPFEDWPDLVQKFQRAKGLGGEILNSAHEFLYTRQVVEQLMNKCSKLSGDIERLYNAGMSAVHHQPDMLSAELKLAPYQMIGLNWLVMLHRKGLNGILADEMGLGKTVQIISFLAWLREKAHDEVTHPNLVVVPASTLDNWRNELQRWCPGLNVLMYYGDKEERRLMRIKTMNTTKIKDFHVVLTTYNLITSSPEEKKMFKTIRFEYVIFDEAHMLKNMNTQRYEQLSVINAHRRILLTGTPLQNSLLELMSLLTFVMPDMFKNKKQYLKCLFTRNSIKEKGEEAKDVPESLPRFEQEQVAQAKKIMNPFVLRRLKKDVLKDLPAKTDLIRHCDMTSRQRVMYDNLVRTYAQSADVDKMEEGGGEKGLSGLGMMMQLRKLANHPLLLRELYEDSRIPVMARLLVQEPTYKEKNLSYVIEDLSILSDFELHCLCQAYPKLHQHALKDEDILESGKFKFLDDILPTLIENKHRSLIFSQFVIMLDILQQYLILRGRKFLRLDGSTPVPVRQELIDEFNRDESISVFLLSTRAGGLGINLTAADTVIIHDLDFNPYNDKQAEDRCHRVGQTKPVTVYRLISKSSIELDIHQIATEKLHLEKEISAEDKDVVEPKHLLRKILGLDNGGKS